MSREHDDELLWETVVLLKDQNLTENALALFKSLINRTFSTLNVPTNFLEELNIQPPTGETLSQIRSLDKEIYQALKSQDTLQAYKYLVDYIKEFSEVIPGSDQKEVMAKLLYTCCLNDTPNEILRPIHIEENEEFLTSTEAAEIIGVSDQTIRRWCEKGKYPDAFQTEGGHWRIPKKYLKISYKQARKRNSFEDRLDQFNMKVGEVSGDEYL
ncbi:excisionase family DNA binding protein [Gracilibacillus halotolerans]|uniref:Excisionase family DNA binding protein n=1 Tax=Gracilibacillus halotolerans TaxID=74386 RepID=A0A841RQ97_9BACI|nr:helix-turn-helix domain-containing protein [Gracilibacillus halotolerans]MBB6514017.1 excisionase family DNA binding protein [Gracilibacillus halotolerans]